IPAMLGSRAVDPAWPPVAVRGPRGAGRSARRPGQGLQLEVLLEARDAHLAADARLLVAAEGRVGRVPHPAVDADGPGADAAGHRRRPLDVGPVDGPRQAEDRVVGDLDGVVVV